MTEREGLTDGSWSKEWTKQITASVPPERSYNRWYKRLPFWRRSQKGAYCAGFMVGMQASLRIIEEVAAFRSITDER